MFISRFFCVTLKQIHYVCPKQKSVQYDWRWAFGQNLFHVLKKSRKLISNTSKVGGWGGG